MMSKSACTPRFTVIAVSGLLLGLGVTVLAVKPFFGPRAAFKRLVTRPIPQSVRNIKVNRYQKASLLTRWRGGQNHIFVLRFDISREDFSKIVTTRRFKPWGSATYADGIFLYKTTEGLRTRVVPLYYNEKSRKAPSWFDLDKWKGAETYFMGQDTSIDWGDVNLLLYNEQLGSAYSITWHWH